MFKRIKEILKGKVEESKGYKLFRRVTSLGLAGMLAIVFPNEIIAWLSAGAGILYGKGIIGLGLMTSIVTFLGSAAGILVQKLVFCGLTYLFSNIILKQGKRLVSFIGSKIKKAFGKNKRNTTEVKKSEPQPVKKIEEPVKKKEEPVKEAKKEAPTPEPVKESPAPVEAPEIPKVRKLGEHPAVKR